MLVDYHMHVLSHGEYEYRREWLNSFINTACSNGMQEIGFSEHNEFFPNIDFGIYNSVKLERQSDINLRLGIEVDYIPGQENNIKKLVNNPGLDYSIGSVHFINGWAFDHPDYKFGFDTRDIDEVYLGYTEILISMVKSGLFDIVGHLDLIKVWGHRPSKKHSVHYFEPVLKELQFSDMTVEINSAGLRKPVKEIYPQAEIVKRMFESNIPITFGSDAHHPEQVGEGLNEAYKMAWDAGYRKLIMYHHHQKTVCPIK